MKWFAKRHLGKAMWFSVGVVALVAIDGHAVGQCEIDKFLPSDVTGTTFGTALSINATRRNKVAIIGAFANAINGKLVGSAFIYRFNPLKSGWEREAKIFASDGEARDWFGSSVSISGTLEHEIVIVGTWADDDNGMDSGSAYIFRFNSDTSEWVEEQKLLASDGAAGDSFSNSVSVCGTPGNEVAIVGAFHGHGLTPLSGAVYIYHFNGVNWVEEAKLFASDGEIRDGFGRSVSITGTSGNEIAIVGGNTDVVYIYRFNPVTSGWDEEQKLVPSDGLTGVRFGWSVSISGAPGKEVAIVGAYYDNDLGLHSGAAYIYRFNPDISGWEEESKIHASDGAENDFYGANVSINSTPGNDVVIVGAHGNGDQGRLTGSAYIYRFNPDTLDWDRELKLLAADSVEGSIFGRTVSISGAPGNEVALIGARFIDDHSRIFGTAYVFGLDNSACCPADINGDGIVDVLDLLQVIHALFTRGEVAEDLDGDGVVTFRDVLIVIQSFGSCDDLNPESCPADLNGDGTVDVPDLLLLLGSWGLCPAPCPSDLNGDDAVNVSDLLAIIAAWGPCP